MEFRERKSPVIFQVNNTAMLIKKAANFGLL